MIDLHTHTRYSDGADDVETLFRKAEKAGLTMLSITDHNTVAAYRDPAMANPAEYYSGVLLPGVEITCMYQGEVVEILGYGWRLDDMERELAGHVPGFAEKQRREFELICTALKQAGAVFEPSEAVFDPEKESGRKAVWQQLKKHPENRHLFLSKESWESSRAFTRQEIYNPLSALYVDEASLYPEIGTAAEMIHRSGGIALLAHLYIYANALSIRGELERFIRRFGLDGAECAHSSFTEEQIRDLNCFCRSHGFLRSGGSDYHGSRKPGVELGTGCGQLHVTEEYLDRWPVRVRTVTLE